MNAKTIWTVGHSNHTIEAFLGLLVGSSIKLLADVRRFPGSRRQPQFGGDALRNALHGSAIGYRHFPDLGGRRRERLPNSPNTGWRVESFNAYADYMLSEPFSTALNLLESEAAAVPTALMCAEAVPWRCHRRLIGDALLVRGWDVQDIFSAGRITPHKLTPFARVEGLCVTYPALTSEAADG
ncbi:hypothetical protein Pla175_21950 [Pirellulimonas nuda]|uniref:DUF488 domain-containing protein n=1 Tax=Pirellulimonas nuda TaxID=2528009 RepID=A0A518DBG0_9BACT|nr:DUF488 domain-containing protein [Pirellulimonas nuda]QDU88811.1 hypothetical protein Pla175_21950 [Pirellulimonas nuda]